MVRKVCQPTDLSQTKEKIQILDIAILFPIPPNRNNHVSTSHDGWMGNDAPTVEQFAFNLSVFNRPGCPVKRQPALIDHDDCGPAQYYLRVLLKKLDLRSESVGVSNIVRVHPSDVTALCPLQQFIKRGDDTTVLARHHNYAWILRRVTTHDFQRTVSASVVHHEKRKACERLR